MTKTLFLLYHDLDSEAFPSEKEDLATRETVVRLTEFESHMAVLAENDRHVMSMHHFLEKQRLGQVDDQDIVLTFDDGHMSNYTLAYPVLQQHGFTATFFIVADRIGKPYHMGIKELHELAGAGMEIASHGLTHRYLPQLSLQEVARELAESKEIIEKSIGQPVYSFAYPGGHYDDNILNCIKKTNYEAAASCIVGWNNSKVDLFMLRRVELRRGTSAADFQHAIKVGNILFYKGIDSTKRVIKKIVGLERYKALRQKLYFLYPFNR
jgi:peptidoglycan/xylan/chitin deacetylase (PgdA/CDA1 family)